jgi:HK97 family phage major capsid protein
VSASLKELLATRRRLAVDRAQGLAEKVATGDSRSVAAQTEIEEALADIRHYSSLYADLSDVAGDTGTYNRYSDRSVIADLRSQSPSAQDRVRASNRQTAVDGRVEVRDLGVGTTIAAVPDWLVAEARPMAIKRAPVLTTFAKPLPARSGIDLKLPQFTTEPVAAPQAALNSALVTATFADAGIDAPVRTFGAQVSVALQLIEQSPVAVDRHILPTLSAAVDAAIETSLFTGDGTGGHVVGLLNAATSTETYTDTTPTLVEAFPKLEAVVRDVETAGARGGTPIVVMHPRRLSWFRQTAVVEKVNLGWSPPPIAGATVGWFGGDVAVIADSAIPTTNGTGTNEDVIVVMRSADVLDLYAAAPRVRVNESVAGSSTLSATITVSKMVAFSAARLPAAVGVLTGSGLAAP